MREQLCDPPRMAKQIERVLRFIGIAIKIGPIMKMIVRQSNAPRAYCRTSIAPFGRTALRTIT